MLLTHKSFHGKREKFCFLNSKIEINEEMKQMRGYKAQINKQIEKNIETPK